MKSEWKNIRLLFCFLFISLLLTGCIGAAEAKPLKAVAIIDHFPEENHALIREVNPDIVDIHYLSDHVEQYATHLGTESEDFFVIVKGKVDEIKVEDFQKDATNMHSELPDDIKDYLAESVFRKIYLDNSTIPLMDTYEKGRENFQLEVEQEYYFFVTIYNAFSGDYDYQITAAYPV